MRIGVPGMGKNGVAQETRNRFFSLTKIVAQRRLSIQKGMREADKILNADLREVGKDRRPGNEYS